ncbi:PR domain zinc finger protein 10 isoform X1 [Nasonia vitripennis]|uniref:PR domain zinc finger protein 10 n=1 Tax=Nasonia vitripennis TaxID=7425 RepID=A0A7M7Q5P3_NASVI|nr:PR domain zinc finger protein 10 isoform X1 [Nasonia vitripennis]
MDQRGPPEGAPVVIADPMDMTIIDKVCNESNWPDDNIVSSSTFCDNPRKLNNKLLFLTVEYVEDQARDFGRMYPYEQVSFSSRANSPLSDFEHRVSPHDPNMSSAARYSPTPVPLPSSPFHNSVVVLQEPSSPLISTSESAVRITNGYSSQLTDQSSNPSLSQSDNSEDFTDSTSDGLVSSVGNELMLIQGSNSELEPSSTPLMLSGISASDLTLTRDFLVMQEDHINVMNPMKLNSSLEQNVNQIAETILPHDIDDETNAQISTMKNFKKFTEQPNQILDSNKKEVQWPKDQSIEDNSLWYNEDCDSTCTDVADCTLHSVCTIADQPVPSRAVATLPGLYLSIEKLPSSDIINAQSTEFGIFAKRNIRRRTQFGPIEGILRPYNGSKIEGLPLLLESKEEGDFFQIDVSDENSSNWMRFVRPAKTYEEQNLVISQQNDGIVFLTTRNIMPNEELKAGPSLEYGKRRNLPVLEVKFKNNLDSTVDFCTQSHITTGPLEIADEKVTENSNVDNLRNNCTKLQKKRKPTRSSFQKYVEVNEIKENDSSDISILRSVSKDFKYTGSPKLNDEDKEKENSPDSKLELMEQEVTQSDQTDISEKNANVVSSSIYKCEICSKRFSTKLKFQQHCLVHGVKDNESLTCNVCLKTFLNNSSLSRHLKTHQKERQTLECPVCSEAFGRVLTLKDFAETHLNQYETFTCPHCPKSFTSYALTRKHARAHHFDRKHECQFCLKCFPAADKLRMHLLKHSDRREFQCANCGKQFKRKDKLKDHVTRVHYTPKTNKDQLSSNNRAKKAIPKQTNPVDCDRFIYKCRRCQVGFKRRGMLVNHLAKRHPDVPPESVPELSLPILRQTRDYYCQYCDKVYKSSSKRKAHIMKNHPGAALPPSNRNKEFDIPGLPNPTFSQAAGSIKTAPQGCQWCHKQYASKAKLLQHQRKKHSSLMEPADQIPRPRSRPPQNQNQPPPTSASSTANNKSDNSNEESSSEAAFLKPRIIRTNGTSGESLPISNNNNNGFELLTSGPQFARVRDMR